MGIVRRIGAPGLLALIEPGGDQNGACPHLLLCTFKIHHKANLLSEGAWSSQPHTTILALPAITPIALLRTAECRAALLGRGDPLAAHRNLFQTSGTMIVVALHGSDGQTGAMLTMGAGDI